MHGNNGQPNFNNNPGMNNMQQNNDGGAGGEQPLGYLREEEEKSGTRRCRCCSRSRGPSLHPRVDGGAAQGAAQGARPEHEGQKG